MLTALRDLGPEVIVPGHGPPGGPGLLEETAGYLDFVQKAAADRYAAGRPVPDAAAGLDLGRYTELTDAERIVGNLYRAYAELDGRDRGCPLDEARCFAGMVAYNGGKPLRCLA